MEHELGSFDCRLGGGNNQMAFGQQNAASQHSSESNLVENRDVPDAREATSNGRGEAARQESREIKPAGLVSAAYLDQQVIDMP